MELLPRQDPLSHFLPHFYPTINPKIAFASTAYKALTALQERDTRDVAGILWEKPWNLWKSSQKMN